MGSGGLWRYYADESPSAPENLRPFILVRIEVNASRTSSVGKL